MTPFRIKPSLVVTPISEHVSFSDEGPLLETFEFFAVSHYSYQPLNFLPNQLYKMFQFSQTRQFSKPCYQLVLNAF